MNWTPEKLRKLRDKLNLTQEKMAELLEVKKSTYVQYETEPHYMSHRDLNKAQKWTRMKAEKILKETEEQK